MNQENQPEIVPDVNTLFSKYLELVRGGQEHANAWRALEMNTKSAEVQLEVMRLIENMGLLDS